MFRLSVALQRSRVMVALRPEKPLLVVDRQQQPIASINSPPPPLQNSAENATSERTAKGEIEAGRLALEKAECCSCPNVEIQSLPHSYVNYLTTDRNEIGSESQ